MANKNKAVTKFAGESAAAATTNAPNTSLLAMFSGVNAPAIPAGKNVVRRNLPQMLKPSEIPMGVTVSGTIKQIVDSPVSTIKGKLLWLSNTSADGKEIEFMLPCTGVIRSALAPGCKDDGEKLTAVLEKEVGTKLYVTRQPDRPSKYKKQMFMFDVFTEKA